MRRASVDRSGAARGAPSAARVGVRGADRTLMNPKPRLVWLFDVDGTLLLTDGAAREAFAGAVLDRFGIADDLRDIGFAGRTEPLILADILRKHGRGLPAAEEAAFWNAVFDRMERTLVPPRGRLLPGVEPLMDRMAAEPGWVLGLLTGNMTQMARIKLERFGLADRFRFGTFGEEGEDRDALARLAVERARRLYGVPASRCVVVGDTEHDITCARAAGALAVAVATGGRRRDELSAHRPDLALDDFSDPEPLIEWAQTVAAGD